MGRLRVVPTALVAVGLLVLGGLAAVAPSSMAQDAMGTPDAMAHDHPAHIHGGTCETLGDVVFPLDNLADAHDGGTPMAGTDASPMASMDGTPAAGMGEVVAESTTTVEAALDDILAAEHAINVHESPENIQNYIACGDLVGPADGGRLEVALDEQNDSGYEGTATLEDNGDGTTTVTVVLMHTHAEDGMATPEA